MRLKSTLIFIYFSLVSIVGYSQITIVSGVPSAYVNTVANGQTFNLGIPLGTTIPTPDAGTNTYKIDLPNGGCVPDYFIVRSGGIWKIGASFTGCMGIILAYDYSTPSTSIDPPCTGLWKRYGLPNVPPAPTNTFPTGILDFITLTGTTCSLGAFPIGCTSILCDYIQLPQKSTVQLNAIPSPIQGMFSYDSYKNAPSWYDGGVWKTIYNGTGDFSVGGNISVFGNINATNNLIVGGSINSNQISNTGLFKNNGNIKIDQTSGVNKLSFLSSGVYEHEIYANSPTSMLHTIDGTPYMEIGNSGLTLIASGITTNGPSGFNSGIKYPITTTSSAITLNASNYVVVFIVASACTLPAAAASNKGQVFKIINHSSGLVPITPSITTGAVTTVSSLISGTTIEIISDGTVWRKLN